MRPTAVVARAALIAVLVTVAVPGLVGSQTPTVTDEVSPGSFRAVAVAEAGTPTRPLLDPTLRSAGQLALDDALTEPFATTTPAPRGGAAVPAASPLVVAINPWIRDPEISWYGPGFFGNGMACGGKLTKETVGVAHRTLPCGTKVTFRWRGKTVKVQVIDRGPYVAGRTWDLTAAACRAIDHCFTGPIDYRMGW